ncbi:MAG TPA: tetraacyldisaccharide 4'-kinase [Burkholderiaceae bacterium]|jgi:tetraacyldisaccharide 4'-kinase|nr:tetraacyldisaccharide 4'-kinase [Burkholderiaceae bacterium]
MRLRAWLETGRQAFERDLLDRWFAPRPPDLIDRLILRPLSALVGPVARRRRQHVARQSPAKRPAVIVVGNLVAGGAGKTPLAIELARALTERGWKVGMLARGHRAALTGARLVVPDDDPRMQGDEPVLLARETGLPVACGIDRGQALALLADRHPEIEVVISDDGLQHGRLPRSLELAVFDERGAGNGRLLPAGPLREPLAHLAGMDAVLLRSPATGLRGLDAVAPGLPMFHFAVRPVGFVRLTDAATMVPIDVFRALADGSAVHALAGIAQPERFFASLRESGVIARTTQALTDHAPAQAAALPADAELIVMTAKDAVKFAGLADARCWHLAVRACCEPALIDWLEESLRGPSTH